MNSLPQKFGHEPSEEMHQLQTQNTQPSYLHNPSSHHHSPFPPTQRHDISKPVDPRNVPGSGPVGFSHHRNTQPGPAFTQNFTFSSCDGSHIPSSSSTLTNTNTTSSGFTHPLIVSSGNQTYRYNVGSSTNNNNNNISSNSNSADNNTGSTGLEAPEPLASLPVLPPTLPLPGGSSSIGKRHSSTGVHPSDSSGSNESHGSSFPLSFQPPPSSPVSYQGHDTGLATGGNKGAGGGVNDANGGSNSHNTNNTSNAPFQGPYSNPASLDMLSGLQGTRKQQPIYQQITHHPQPQQHQYQQQQLPFRQASSSYSMTPLSASLPVPSGFQYYGQQQQSSKQQQQEPFYRPLQHHYPSDPSLNRTQQPTSPSTPFPRDTLARSRSQSLTVLTTTTAPISVPSAQGVSTGAPPASYATTLVNTATTTVTGESIDNSSQSKKVVIPRRPRILPPRPPQLTAPRKYHGRQMRKPSIHHHPIPSDLLELVSPSRRVAHIASEQKRREKINSGFEELKSVIPECAQNTDSKASILRKAVDRILELEDELRRYTDPPQQQQHEGEEEPEREE